MAVSQKLTIYISHDPIILEEIYIYIHSKIIYNSPELEANKCLSVDEWINKL